MLMLVLVSIADTGSPYGPSNTGCNALMDGVFGTAASFVKDYGLDPLTKKSVQGIAEMFKMDQLNKIVQKALDGIEWKKFWTVKGVSKFSILISII